MAAPIFKRSMVDEITPFLTTKEAVVLHGARQVGKTSLMQYLRDLLIAQGTVVHFIDLEDSRMVRILDAGVDEFLKYLREEGVHLAGGARVVIFIDEIQYLKNPSEFLKLIVDHHPELKLIVSGSSSFEIKAKFKDSLVGRTLHFEIFPLSFEEFLLFRGMHVPKEIPLTAKKHEELTSLFTEYVWYGGYPQIVLTPDLTMKERYLQQIIDTYVKKDIRDLGAVKDVEKFNRLLEALASQSGQLLNVSELANTLRMAKATVEDYLFLLEQTYVVARVRPFYRNMRSELSKTPKIFFYDTGLMHMLWLKQLPKEMLGQAFETSVFTELVKKYGQGSIRYWRTAQGHEIDFILQKRGGMQPFEVKLHFAQWQEATEKAFLKKYPEQSAVQVVGLKGEKVAHGLYPWEL